MLIGQTQLKRRFESIYPSSAGAKPRASQSLYLIGLGSIVAMNCGECCPHREVNMVGPLYVHGHPHRWCVSDIWMNGVICWHNQTGSDRLFAEIIFKDLLLDAFHNMATEVSHHSQVHACIHQPK